MKELIKKIYQFKINFVFFFNLGYSEFATPIAVLRDIGITLGVLKILFKISLGAVTDILICTIAFMAFYIIGRILKATGMSDYANKLSNSINPEMKKINQIADHLGIGINKDFIVRGCGETNCDFHGEQNNK